MQRDQRAFKRYNSRIKVTTKEGGEELSLLTGNVSRSGAFVFTDNPKPLGFLVKLAFQLPDQSTVSVMAKVARSIAPDENEQCGMGVAFFCLDKDHKDRWDQFVIQMASENAAPPSIATPSPVSAGGGLERLGEGSGLDRLGSRAAFSGGFEFRKPLDLRSDERHVTSFLVRLKDRERLHQFFSNDISTGGMFLKTPLLKREGEEVELIVVHPETEDEFRLGGVVKRVVKGSIRDRGMGIEFSTLSDEILEALREFILTGINFLDSFPQPEEDDELEFSPAQWKQAL